VTGITLSGVITLAIQIGGAGPFYNVYTSPSSITIPNNTYFNFYQGFYLGANPSTGNSFRVTVTGQSGYGSNTLTNTAGSTSTPANFSVVGTTATATTFSSTSQYAIALVIT